jgi:hypothetical protein
MAMIPSGSSDELQDSEQELNSAGWFVSLLTRVDGLVLMAGDISVQGLGLEITDAPTPAAVYRALNPRGTSETR